MSDSGMDIQRTSDFGLANCSTGRLEANGDDVLAKVETTCRLVVQTTRDFGHAVAVARARGFSWEEISEHVPTFARAYGPEAAEKLFELASAAGSGQTGRYLRWCCPECEGLVLDHGPYGGHPADNEPGHREGCGRHASEVSTYVAGLERDDLVAPGSAQDRPELPYPSLQPLPERIELG
ncbi:MAG TPA: hypothetical protein VK988_03950 [Acidimicrobiales bacterium]|nr:hypothetical protein [Acidimicrobiales bacterium]